MPRPFSASEIGVFHLFVLASLVSGYSFSFTSQPQQCSTLSIQISGSGVPPYSILIVPYGPSPLPNNVEVREPIYQQYSADASSLNFQLNYPTNSQFVAVVSDQSGFGSGGTSIATTVMESNDASCFDPSQSVPPDFFYNIDPSNQIVQCSPSRLWWDPSNVQGNVNFQGVIPGGQSFSIPVGTITDQTNMGTGFEWIPTVRAGITLLVVSGDGRGLGTGGYALFTVSAGLNPNSSCIMTTSPSSTAGPPAGGIHPTSTSSTAASASASNPTNSNASNRRNTNVLVGGIVGGVSVVAILGIILFFLMRRKGTASSSQEPPLNLFQGNNEPSYYLPSPHDGARVPQLRSYDPYHVGELMLSPDGMRQSIAASSSLSTSFTSGPYVTAAQHQRLSGVPSEPRSVVSEHGDVPACLVPGGSRSSISPSNTLKVGVSRDLNPTQVIQHVDARPNVIAEKSEQAQTIDLPPAYTRGVPFK